MPQVMGSQPGRLQRSRETLRAGDPPSQEGMWGAPILSYPPETFLLHLFAFPP